MAENEEATPMETQNQQEDLSNIAGPGAIDISPDSDGGVWKLVKKVGTGEDGPMVGDTVSVHYVGTLTDGSKFDSSRDRGEKFDFTLGKGQVIKAWDVGVASMKRGELSVLVCRGDYAYGKAGSPPKIPPNATLLFEVELFDWKGEDLSPDMDGSIQRSTLEKGSGYDTPNDGATVKVHLVGRCNGKIFEDRDVSFAIGEGSEISVVEGVEIALKKFKKGEKSLLKLKASQAYGAEGNAEKNIPSWADVEYEVTLIQFEKLKESWELDPPERIEQGDIAKTQGTKYFKEGKLKLAKSSYKRVLDYLENETEMDSEEMQKKRDAICLAAYLNLAMCHLKLNSHTEAVNHCDKALEMDPQNEKGLFRRGQAHSALQIYDSAIQDFKKVLEIDQNNKAAKNQITIIHQKIKQQKEKDKKRYAGMFQKFAEQDAKMNEKEYQRLNSGEVFHNINDWSNDMAKDMMPLEQEMEAFGEKMPEPKYDKEDCKGKAEEED